MCQMRMTKMPDDAKPGFSQCSDAKPGFFQCRCDSDDCYYLESEKCEPCRLCDKRQRLRGCGGEEAGECVACEG
jgi:hypothetical protein